MTTLRCMNCHAIFRPWELVNQEGSTLGATPLGATPLGEKGIEITNYSYCPLCQSNRIRIQLPGYTPFVPTARPVTVWDILGMAWVMLWELAIWVTCALFLWGLMKFVLEVIK